jgi:phosphohistidine swiveling domain-containing protein
MAQRLDSVDWVFYIKRQSPFFVGAAQVIHYGTQLQEETGFSFEHQVSYCQNGMMYLFRSAQEMKDADAHFAELIQNNDPRLEKWFDTEKRVHTEIKDAKSYSNEDKIDFFLKASFFNTILPYRLHSALQTMKQKPKEIEETVEKIRGSASLYPILVDSLLGRVFEQAGKQLAVSTEMATLLTPYEVKDVLNKGLTITKDQLEKRMDASYIIKDENVLDVEYGTPPFVQDFLAQGKKELTGQIAFKGQATGTVKIVNIPSQMEKMEQGDILVSINTNPSIMAAIRKAGAIVTDEGGALCHAAIISRELEIPCITGTHHATDMLKDGDRVTVDAEIGFVKRVEK